MFATQCDAHILMRTRVEGEKCQVFGSNCHINYSMAIFLIFLALMNIEKNHP